ncbi:TPA: hypothetical protein MND73_004300 [Salmonella enterica subsp. houtenae]|nr:hypothetical protein [Salmonella enterica subsp. houtenae]
MDGFAKGLLQGFSTVDQAMNRREEMGLRQAYLARQQKNADRNYQLAQDEFGYRKDSDQRTFDYNKERNTVADQHWDKDFGLKQYDTKARLGMAQQQLAMQRESHNFEMNNARYQQMMQQNEPTTRGIMNAIQAGDWSAAQDMAADADDRIPIVRILKNPKYAQSTIDAGQKIHEIMSSPDAHKDPMAVMDGINGNMGTIAPLFQTEADRAVGQVDPETGQKIVSAQVNHIAPVPDKNDPNHHSPDDVGVFLKVKYADGTEAIRPVTEHRSSDPKDNVKRVSITGLLNTASSRVQTSHNYLQYLQQPQGMTLADKQKIAGNSAAGAARAGNDPGEAYESMMGALGVPEYKEKVLQTQATNTAKAWAGDDPAKQEFMQGALSQSPELFASGNEKQRDIYFQNFKSQQQNQRKNNSASVAANGLRDARMMKYQTLGSD